MLRGFYTAASGMIAQQRRQEALSNNIANAQTPGYKQDQASLRAFPELLLEKRESLEMPGARNTHIPMNSRIGSINSGVYVQEITPDFSQGTLRETGTSTDMALVNGIMPDQAGSFFYTVQGENGEVQYTRNGNFTVDSEGFLTTNQGNYVLDQEGNPIFTDGLEFEVSKDGTIQTAEMETPLGIAYTADANNLRKEGQGLFGLEEGADPAVDARALEGASFTVLQRSLEGSNVDSLQSMTEMMSAYRSFETNQTVLKAFDQSMEKTVNEIGRLR